MRRFCCFSFFENKDTHEETNLKKNCLEEEISKSKEKQTQETDEILSITNISPNPAKDKIFHRHSFGSTQPGSISCPHLMIENHSSRSNEQRGFCNSVRSISRNNPSGRFNGTASQKHNRTRNSFHQNSLLTQTNSFKRIISFRSSKKESESRVFQLNFLGQIYRKRNPASTNTTSSNLQNDMKDMSEDELNLLTES